MGNIYAEFDENTQQFHLYSVHKVISAFVYCDFDLQNK